MGSALGDRTPPATGWATEPMGGIDRIDPRNGIDHHHSTDHHDSHALPPIPVKVVIAGGFGVGKTTFVGAVSEIPPLTTEAAMTAASIGIDDTTEVGAKTTTTVALDFGRITVDGQLVLYLFGTPGQDRFWFMWDDLAQGAVGAVVLVDLRRVDDCFPAVDYFEDRRLPFVVAINTFADAADHGDDDVRAALALAPDVPLLRVDARRAGAASDALIALVEHALERAD